jgi:hypothetical protein
MEFWDEEGWSARTTCSGAVGVCTPGMSGHWQLLQGSRGCRGGGGGANKCALYAGLPLLLLQSYSAIHSVRAAYCHTEAVVASCTSHPAEVGLLQAAAARTTSSCIQQQRCPLQASAAAV